MSKDITELVSVANGKSVTTSLKVAEFFGKEHKHVLESIRNLDCPDDFNQTNFRLVDYKDAKGEKRPMYLMTRDGFTLLAMGFTGEKAMKFKIAYIQAFNAMESAITEARSGMLSVEDALKKFEPIIRENEQLRMQYSFAKNFLPSGHAGDLNSKGVPKNQYRKGYFTSGNGKPAAVLLISFEQPNLFDLGTTEFIDD